MGNAPLPLSCVQVQAKKLHPSDRPRLDLAARIVHRCAVTFVRVTADPSACTVLCVEGQAAITALSGLLDCIDGMAVAASSPVDRISASERLRPVSPEDDPVLAAMGGAMGGEDCQAADLAAYRRAAQESSTRHASVSGARPFLRRRLGDSVSLRDLLTSAAVATAVSLAQLSACRGPGNLLGLEGLPQLAARLLCLSEGRPSIMAFPAVAPRQLRFDMVRAPAAAHVILPSPRRTLRHPPLYPQVRDVYRSALFDDLPCAPGEPPGSDSSISLLPGVRACIASAAVTAAFNAVNHPNGAAVTYLHNACAKEAEARAAAAALEIRRSSSGALGIAAVEAVALGSDGLLRRRRRSSVQSPGASSDGEGVRSSGKPPALRSRQESVTTVALEPAPPAAAGPQDIGPAGLLTRMLAAMQALAMRPVGPGETRGACDAAASFASLSSHPRHVPADAATVEAAHLSLQEMLTCVLSVAATACGPSQQKHKPKPSKQKQQEQQQSKAAKGSGSGPGQDAAAELAAARSLHDYALLTQLAQLCETYACRCGGEEEEGGGRRWGGEAAAGVGLPGSHPCATHSMPRPPFLHLPPPLQRRGRGRGDAPRQHRLCGPLQVRAPARPGLARRHPAAQPEHPPGGPRGSSAVACCLARRWGRHDPWGDRGRRLVSVGQPAPPVPVCDDCCRWLGRGRARDVCGRHVGRRHGGDTRRGTGEAHGRGAGSSSRGSSSRRAG